MARKSQDEDIYEDDEEGGAFRWLSSFVVLLAVAGFFGLAWYAYNNGGQPVDEKEVELITADTTPVKEAPANPGGMEIPNQDKTVYGLISGGKTEKPAVERVLPAPEEPVARKPETETWINDRAKEPQIAKAEEPDDKRTEQFKPSKARDTAEKTEAKTDTKPLEAKTETKPQPAKPEKSNTSVASLASEAPSAGSKPTEKEVKAEEVKEKETPKETPKTETKPAPAPKPEGVKPAVSERPKGTARVQLGSYRSEADAKTAAGSITRKFANISHDKQVVITRADLGAKGTFYRLQLGGFASTKDAESYCTQLTKSGQACILVKGK